MAGRGVIKIFVYATRSGYEDGHSHRGVPPGAGGFGRGAAGGEVEVAEKASKGGWDD